MWSRICDMIKLNARDYPWREGMTVKSLLAENQYVYSRIVVKINGRLVDEARYADTKIADGDDVQALHLMAGG